MAYEQRIQIVAALRAMKEEDVTALRNLLEETKSENRATVVKKAFPKLYATAEGNVRQIRFHAFADRYAKAAGLAFAIDGGEKSEQATYYGAIDPEGHEIAVIVAPEGSPEKTKILHTYTGTGNVDRAKACARAERMGQPYVPKTKGRFAVDTSGLHVNAAMVSVTNYESARNKNTFQVYRPVKK